MRRIITYQNTIKNGQVIPTVSLYESLDLNSLQISAISSEECNRIARSLHITYRSYHKNFYVQIGSDVKIYDKKSSYDKTLIQYSSKPINSGWCSANYEYIAIDHSVVNRISKLVLYRLKYNGPKENMFFTSSNPYKYFGESFKTEFDNVNGIGIFATVYEPNVNPLTGKNVGPDKSKHISELEIREVRADGRIVYKVSRDYGKTIEDGFVVSNF